MSISNLTVQQLREVRVRTIDEVVRSLVAARDGIDDQIEKLRAEQARHQEMLENPSREVGGAFARAEKFCLTGDTAVLLEGLPGGRDEADR